MQDMVRVVVDAMGGDNAPGEIVKGAVEALNAREDIFIYLTGRKPVIEAELSKYTFPKERLEIVHTEEVSGNGRTACHGNSQEKRFFDRKRYEYGQAERSRCVCFCRKQRSDPCRRSGDRWQDQRN